VQSMSQLGRTMSVGAAQAAAALAWAPEADSPCGRVITQGRRNYNGLWASNWGGVNLVQEGSQVTGTFEGTHPGRLRGSVRGQKLTFSWRQRNGQTGRGVYRLSSDGCAIEGSWGLADSATDGGAWILSRAL